MRRAAALAARPALSSFSDTMLSWQHVPALPHMSLQQSVLKPQACPMANPCDASSGVSVSTCEVVSSEGHGMGGQVCRHVAG